MLTPTPIRYIALDFDNCICEINSSFHLLWDLYDRLSIHPELYEYSFAFRKQWIVELDNALCDQKLNFLNDDLLMLFKHIQYGPLSVKPKVVVYTNNSDEHLVSFLRDVIHKSMNLIPWTESFHPQDPRRRNEFPTFSPDEPGKSFQGVAACLGNPADLTPDTLLFLDDLLHPIQQTIGDHYIHIQPPFKSNDSLLPYVETFMKAFIKLEKTLDHDLAFRYMIREYFYEKSLTIDVLSQNSDAYREWDLCSWDKLYDLFKPFDEYKKNEEKDTSLRHYYTCRDFLTPTQDALSS